MQYQNFFIFLKDKTHSPIEKRIYFPIEGDLTTKIDESENRSVPNLQFITFHFYGASHSLILNLHYFLIIPYSR